MAEATTEAPHPQEGNLLDRDILQMSEKDAQELRDRAAKIKKEFDDQEKAKQQGKFKDTRSLEERIRKHEEYIESQTALEQAEKRLDIGEPAKVLRERNHDLRDYGWGEEEIEAVKDRLKDPELLKLTDEQAWNAVENFIGSGVTAEEALEKLTKDRLLEKQQEMAQQSRTPETDGKIAWLQEAGITGNKSERNIERYVMNEDPYISQKLAHEYDANLPANIDEFAWQINHDDPHTFGVNGRYPVMQMEVHERKDKHGNVERDEKGRKRLEGKYVVNQANMMRWVRERLWYFQEKDEDEFTDYMQYVRLPKSMRNVDLNEVFDNKARYFTDEEGHSDPYDGLYNQMLAEIIGMIHLRKHDLEYIHKQGSGEELNKKLQELYYKSKLTKQSFGTSYFHTMAKTPLDYRGSRSDDTVGSAFTTLLLAHYNFGDLPELVKVLGEDSSFFTKEGMMKAVQEIYEQKLKGRDIIRSHELSKILGDKDKAKYFEKAFDEDGKVKAVRDKDGKIIGDDPEHGFTKFINWYGDGMQQAHILQDIVSKALENALYERYDFYSKEQNMYTKGDNEGELIRDKTGYRIAWLMVHSLQRFTGLAVKNDVNSTGWDYAYKWLETEAYRRKMATVQRGNGAGNPYTIGMFKSVMVDFMRGVRTSEAHVKVVDQFGRPVYKRKADGTFETGKDGKKVQATRKKTILEVFQDINDLKKTEKKDRAGKDKQLEKALHDVKEANAAVKMAEQADDEAAVKVAKEKLKQVHANALAIQHELREFTEVYSRKSKQISGQFVFHENTMRDYAINHIDKASKVYDQIIGAKEINFDKFTKFDPIRGITFDRAEFISQFQQGFLHPLRYLFNTYGELNFNMPVRSRVFKYRDVKQDKDVYEYKDMQLGEAMFGYEILNIPKFRMRETLSNGKEGRYLKDPKTGRYIIDYEKVQNDKPEAYKQWALMKIAGDLWAHIDRHSTDPAYDMRHYLNIIEAVANVPGGLEGDDSSLRKAGVVRNYFSKEQIKWLRKQAGATNVRMYTKQALSDLFRHHKDKESYFSDSFKLFWKGVFKGYN